MSRVRGAGTIAVLLCLHSSVLAQSSGGGDNPFADLITGLSFLTLTDEITGITATIDSSAPDVAPTKLSTYKFPWSRDIDVGSNAGTLYVEAVASYLRAKDSLELDMLSGRAALTQKWQAVGGMAGVGWTFPITEHLKLRPSVSAALTYLRNDATFGGPGGDELAGAISGSLVDFDAWAATGMGALTGIYERPLGPVDFQLKARSTWAATNVFAASSEYQEGHDTSNIFVTRADFDGDLPLQIRARNVGWNLFSSYIHFYNVTEGSLGFDQAYEVGGGLTLPLIEGFPAIGLGAGILFGPDIQGYTVGLSLGS